MNVNTGRRHIRTEYIVTAGIILFGLFIYLTNMHMQNQSILDKIEKAENALKFLNLCKNRMVHYISGYIDNNPDLIKDIYDTTLLADKNLNQIQTLYNNNQQKYNTIDQNLTNAMMSYMESNVTRKNVYKVIQNINNIQDITNEIANIKNTTVNVYENAHAQKKYADDLYTSALEQISSVKYLWTNSLNNMKEIEDNLQTSYSLFNDVNQKVNCIINDIITSTEYLNLQVAVKNANKALNEIQDLNLKLKVDNIYKLRVTNLIELLKMTIATTKQYIDNILNVFLLAKSIDDNTANNIEQLKSYIYTIKYLIGIKTNNIKYKLEIIYGEIDMNQLTTLTPCKPYIPDSTYPPDTTYPPEVTYPVVVTTNSSKPTQERGVEYPAITTRTPKPTQEPGVDYPSITTRTPKPTQEPGVDYPINPRIITKIITKYLFNSIEYEYLNGQKLLMFKIGPKQNFIEYGQDIIIFKSYDKAFFINYYNTSDNKLYLYYKLFNIITPQNLKTIIIENIKFSLTYIPSGFNDIYMTYNVDYVVDTKLDNNIEKYGTQNNMLDNYNNIKHMLSKFNQYIKDMTQNFNDITDNVSKINTLTNYIIYKK